MLNNIELTTDALFDLKLTDNEVATLDTEGKVIINDQLHICRREHNRDYVEVRLNGIDVVKRDKVVKFGHINNLCRDYKSLRRLMIIDKRQLINLPNRCVRKRGAKYYLVNREVAKIGEHFYRVFAQNYEQGLIGWLQVDIGRLNIRMSFVSNRSEFGWEEYVNAKTAGEVFISIISDKMLDERDYQLALM